jgi:hypothetical protein
MQIEAKLEEMGLFGPKAPVLPLLSTQNNYRERE